MNSTEETLRRAMRTLAEEATVITEAKDRLSHDGLPRALLPLMAAAVAAILVVSVVIVKRDLGGLENAPVSEAGKHLVVRDLALALPWGIHFSADLTSDERTTVTGTSVDPDLVLDQAEGFIWDNTSDTDMEPEFVTISRSKPVSLNLTLRPRCDLDVDWSRVPITVETDEGSFVMQAATPDLPRLAERWCASPMQVVPGSGSASADWCEVRREFDFINPGGRQATIKLEASEWEAEPLVLAEGQAQGTMVLTSDHACDLPKEKTQFTVVYGDGSSETITGPEPLHNM